MNEIVNFLSKKVDQLQKTRDPLEKVLHLKICWISPIFLENTVFFHFSQHCGRSHNFFEQTMSHMAHLTSLVCRIVFESSSKWNSGQSGKNWGFYIFFQKFCSPPIFIGHPSGQFEIFTPGQWFSKKYRGFIFGLNSIFLSSTWSEINS